MLTPEQRRRLGEELPALSLRYPKLLLPGAMAQAFVHPPASPAECLFSKMSANYTADLRTRVEPCVFGGDPDCSQCGCSISAGLHWIGNMQVAGPLEVRHLARASMSVGSLVNRLVPERAPISRWSGQKMSKSGKREAKDGQLQVLVHIQALEPGLPEEDRVTSPR